MEAELRRLVYSHLKIFADSEGLPVSYPNKKEAFDIDAVDKYMAISPLPTEPEQLTVCGGSSKYIWLIQVSFFIQKDKGEMALHDHIEALRVAFPVNYQFIGANHTFDVIKAPHSFPPISEDGWFSTPAQLRVTTIH